MQFESLDNKLFLDLFEYLDAVNLLRAFHSLNDRFDQLLLIKLQRYHLDFRSITKHDFEIFCQQYLSSINDRVISLHLSDDVETPNLPQMFLSYGYHINQFVHLKSLSIDYTYSFDLLNQILSQCRELSYLTHLRITINNNEDPDQNFRHFIKNIWNLSKLTHCYLDITYPYATWPLEMSVISQSINYLSLKKIYYNSNSLSHLFKRTPNLRRLYTGNIGEFNDQQIQSTFSSLISLTVTIESSVLRMKNLFEKIPNICYLTLEINKISLDGQEWEKILTTYLKSIKIFRFKMSIEFSASEDLEEQIDQLLNSFRSDYWIKKHQWFVQCDWCSIDINNIALLYTLPYAFDTFYYTDGIQSKSTSPNKLDYSSYNRVRILHHTDRIKNVYQNSTSSPIGFIDIRYLKLKFPFNDNFWSVIPALDRLISLDATLNQDSGYSQLQILLDRAPHLYSLRFCYMKTFSMSSFNINSTSIRRLELYQNFSYHLRYFNSAECAVLARSSIVSQCQVLLIEIENRTNILELIRSIPNLRALSVRCKNDQNHQHNSLEIDNHLIEWLRDHSMSKYAYSTIQDLYFGSSINLWIQKGS